MFRHFYLCVAGILLRRCSVVVSDSELLGLVRTYGRVKVSYLEEQLVWLTGDRQMVRASIMELVGKGVLQVPEEGYVRAVS